jgi:hypothetical protein
MQDSETKRAAEVFNAGREGKRIEFYYNQGWHVETEFRAVLDCLKRGFKSRIDCCAECHGEGGSEVSVYSSTLGMDASRMDECETCGGTGKGKEQG